jgi:hypothetical protein
MRRPISLVTSRRGVLAAACASAMPTSIELATPVARILDSFI